MQITMIFQNYVNAENKTATLLKQSLSLNYFNHILISSEDYMRTRYMHYVSLTGQTVQIFFLNLPV